jgi:hypothetical protein
MSNMLTLISNILILMSNILKTISYSLDVYIEPLECS